MEDTLSSKKLTLKLNKRHIHNDQNLCKAKESHKLS